MVVKALSDPNHDREMEVKIDGSHFVTFSIARVGIYRRDPLGRRSEAECGMVSSWEEGILQSSQATDGVLVDIRYRQ